MRRGELQSDCHTYTRSGFCQDSVGSCQSDGIHDIPSRRQAGVAKLDCTIVMKLPGGRGELSGKYVDLEKALYGLKQSSLLWNDLLVEKLVTVHGMEQCMTDPCVFRLIREGKVVLILKVYVDDMAVVGIGVEIDKLLATLNTTLRRITSERYPFARGVPSSRTLKIGC